MCFYQGRTEEAEPFFVKAYEVSVQERGREHPDTLRFSGNLGWLYARTGRLDESEALLEESLQIARRTLGAAHPRTARIRGAMVSDLYPRLIAMTHEEGRSGDSKTYSMKLVELMRETTEQPRASAMNLNSFAWMLLTEMPAGYGDPQQALHLATRACEMTGNKVPHYLDTLALAHYRTGDVARAIEVQRQAIALLPDQDSDLHRELEERLAEYEAAQDP